jgi:flagellin
MTRINTNVSSLIAQTNLARSHDQLQTALTRLSTGLRINSGKDDPAGLIASQVLQTDITSTQGAITNSQRADQLISTADSALGQVSTLLNSIQALVTQSANTGALSASQLQANQLQVDSSLEAIDRIAQTTSFQGQKLLDGNLDFITTGVDTSKVQGLQINQANFGTQTAIGAQVNVIKQASQGSLNYKLGALGSDATLQVSGKNGSNVFQFAAGSSIANIASAVNLVSDATGVQAQVQKAATKGTLDVSSFGTNNDITLTANTAGQSPGNLQVKYSLGGTGGTTVNYTAGVGNAPGTIDVQLQTKASVAATASVDPGNAKDNRLDFAALQAGSDFNGVTVQYIDGTKETAAGITAGQELYAYNQNATAASAALTLTGTKNDLIVTANNAGTAYNGVTIALDGTGANGSGASATYDATNKIITLKVAADDTATAAQAVTAIGTIVDGGGAKLFTASLDKSVEANNDGSGTIDHTDVATGATDKSGTDAKTLSITIKGGVSTAAQVQAALSNAANAHTAALFSSALHPDTTGSGVLVSGIFAGAFASGVDGGGVVATANDVVSAINLSTANTVVTAGLTGSDTGAGVANAFDKFVSSGSVASGNALQFLGTDTAANVRFTSVAGQSLGVDTTTDPQVLGNSKTTLQDATANATLTFTAQAKGTASDGVNVSYVNDANVVQGSEFAVYDKNAKTLTVHIDSGNTTAANVLSAVNSDKYVSQYFHASNFGNSNGTGVVTASDAGTTAGGLVSSGTLIVKLATDSNGIVTTTANDLINFFNAPANSAALSPYGISVSNGIGSTGAGKLAATATDLKFQGNGTTNTDSQATTTTNAVNGVNAQLAITATTPGAGYNGVKVVFQNDNSVTAGNETGVYDATSKTLTVNIQAGFTTATDVKNLITNDTTLNQLFTATAQGTGGGLIDISDTGTLAGGVTTTGTQQGAALQGNSDLADTGLTFTSTTYGSDSFVSVKALSGTFQLTDSTGAASDRSTGTDVEALVNGVRAIGQGLTARLATSALDLSFTVASTVASGSNFDFSITGGGAKFQLGPKVVSNQQARLGISGVSSATLGGTAGKLFELHSGGDKSLTNDVGGAAAVLSQVIDDITSLRGRLGAFQSTTLETNINTLNDTLTNLTTAQSSIQDADFAAESANLTRAQILVQSGTSVLQLSNQAPQQVLALLPRG